MTQTIVLQGMRGSGKSSIARAVAKQLQLPCVDLDQVIVDAIDMTITDYVAQAGWDTFRQQEHDCLTQVFAHHNQGMVLALGGGTIAQERNHRLIKQHADQLIHIHTALSRIAARIADSDQRPSLTGADVLQELQTVYDQRQDIYTRACHYSVENNGDLQQAVDAIVLRAHRGGCCVSISDYSDPQLLTALNDARGGQYIELRIDLMPTLEQWPTRLATSPRRAIVTCRHRNEGGHFTGSFDDSATLLAQASQQGAWAVDYEYSASTARIQQLQNMLTSPTKLIISHHRFDDQRQYQEIVQIINEIASLDDVVIKLALMVSTAAQCQQIYDLQTHIQQHHPDHPHIIIGMGQAGQQTRLETVRHGALLGFASWGDSGTAPGQWSYQDYLQALYD